MGLTLLATALLCFSMRRHQRFVFRRTLPLMAERVLRGLGFVLLLTAACLFARLDGPLVGLTAFTGWLTLCVLAIAATVTVLTARQNS
ncbi:MAG: DUF3325 family protein [Pseudomonadota bacterium]